METGDTALPANPGVYSGNDPSLRSESSWTWCRSSLCSSRTASNSVLAVTPASSRGLRNHTRVVQVAVDSDIQPCFLPGLLLGPLATKIFKATPSALIVELTYPFALATPTSWIVRDLNRNMASPCKLLVLLFLKVLPRPTQHGPVPLLMAYATTRAIRGGWIHICLSTPPT